MRVEDAVDTLQEAITMSCNKSFRKAIPLQKWANQKSVPWWTQELTIRRKKLNAFRRRYQRAQDIALRESRKKTYHTEKSRYQAAIKSEKLKSWKEFCTLTTSTNPWNVVYKLATNKLKTSPTMTTIQKTDVSYTASLEETMQVMLDYHVAVDDKRDDNEHHKSIRKQINEPVKTDDDRDLTLAEVMNAIEEAANKKAPGEDGITGAIYLRVCKTFPTLTYTIYKECVRTGCFPKKWKISKIIPIPKSGSENIKDASKYRTISLINVGGKVLEKILINRITHHLNKNNLMNKNQFGFTPGKSTTDAILAVKYYIEEGIKQRHIAVLISLDVEGAFDAAWWPSIIHALKEFSCPKDLYNLAKSYFSERKVTLCSNSIKIEREVSKG